MLNNQKIKIMTKLAMYEQGDGKKDIKTSYFYKMDYIRYNILKTIVSITIGYILLVSLFAVYNMEYLINKATQLNYKQIGTNLLVLYIVIVTAYIICTILISSVRFKNSRKSLVKYNKDLKELREIYRNEKLEAKEG